MSHIVNFLPWRETRRRQRLRMAGLLIVGLLLILLAAILASRLNKRASHSLETARISADDLLYSALQQRERAMRQRLQQQEQRRLRYLRRGELGQPGSRGNGAAKLHEAPPRHTASGEHLLKL